MDPKLLKLFELLRPITGQFLAYADLCFWREISAQPLSSMQMRSGLVGFAFVNRS